MQGLGSLLIQEVSKRVISYLDEEEKRNDIIKELTNLIHNIWSSDYCKECGIIYIPYELKTPLLCLCSGKIIGCGRSFCKKEIYSYKQCSFCKDSECICSGVEYCSKKGCTESVCGDCTFLTCSRCGDFLCDFHLEQVWKGQLNCKECARFSNAEEEEYMRNQKLEGNFYIEIKKRNGGSV